MMSRFPIRVLLCMFLALSLTGALGWRRLESSMSVARSGHSATPLEGGKILVVGGDQEGSAEIFDPATDTFGPVGSKMSAPRWRHSATLVKDQDGHDLVLVAGGCGENNDPLRSVEIFDVAAGTFRVAEDMGAARAGHTATVVRDKDDHELVLF